MSDLLLQNIVGSNIESAEFETEAKSWFLKFRNGDTLNIECMWRLLEEGFITSTSEDHGQIFGLAEPFNGIKALNEMSAHEIRAVIVCQETGDINITLGQYFILQIIPISAGYESWQYKQEDSKSFVAVGGQVHEY